jgi:hypothetical protein
VATNALPPKRSIPRPWSRKVCWLKRRPNSWWTSLKEKDNPRKKIIQKKKDHSKEEKSFKRRKIIQKKKNHPKENIQQKAYKHTRKKKSPQPEGAAIFFNAFS